MHQGVSDPNSHSSSNVVNSTQLLRTWTTTYKIWCKSCHRQAPWKSAIFLYRIQTPRTITWTHTPGSSTTSLKKRKWRSVSALACNPVASRCHRSARWRVQRLRTRAYNRSQKTGGRLKSIWFTWVAMMYQLRVRSWSLTQSQWKTHTQLDYPLRNLSMNPLPMRFPGQVTQITKYKRANIAHGSLAIVPVTWSLPAYLSM